jgi:hypothetical protein
MSVRSLILIRRDLPCPLGQSEPRSAQLQFLIHLAPNCHNRALGPAMGPVLSILISQLSPLKDSEIRSSVASSVGRRDATSLPFHEEAGPPACCSPAPLKIFGMVVAHVICLLSRSRSCSVSRDSCPTFVTDKVKHKERNKHNDAQNEQTMACTLLR